MTDIPRPAVFPQVPSIDWTALRKGLFGSPLNAAITAGFALLLYGVVFPLFRWAVVDATFTGTAENCRAHDGACWAFLTEKLRFTLFGLYPAELDWQAAAASLVILVATVAAAV